ncbi:DUF4282 domain-containing protein [Rhodococcus rhodnii]|uniref:DUF4282 domain-containing protein n=2 Tax=Rhodococcus rhodnii TaxID=38312 RepID=R7WKZ5_9NOCA|nr:DUF4282 domain-containing protein [Rhodococcus rhodnii]EOM74679.1 hypothetical protein Rrhod_4014 [Rhodococcus rhodnii LMG 5362]TXG90407.1 DUF4282 domain-containing protein [Rhodococcus rhodnii]
MNDSTNAGGTDPNGGAEQSGQQYPGSPYDAGQQQDQQGAQYYGAQQQQQSGGQQQPGGQQYPGAQYGQPQYQQYGQPGAWGGQQQYAHPGQPQPGQPQYGQPQPGQYPAGYPQPGGAPTGGSSDTGFMAALFDLSFNRFAAPSVVRVLYILLMVLVGLGYVAFVAAAFVDGIVSGLATLVVGALIAIVYLALARVSLEFVIAAVRTAQNTSKLVEMAEKK